MRRRLRLLGLGWLFHVKMLAALVVQRRARRSSTRSSSPRSRSSCTARAATSALFYASLGASVMGVWSATSTAAGAALQRERWHGTLELLVAAPAHFALVLLPMTIAMATIGLYSMVADARLGPGRSSASTSTSSTGCSSASSVPATVSRSACSASCSPSSFVRYRTAWALGNLLEYPVWLICGFLVPLSLFPGWVRADLVGARADLGHAARSASRRWAARRCPTCCVCLGARRSSTLAIGVARRRPVPERGPRARATLSLT